MDAPCVLLSSSCENSTDTIVKGILSASSLPKSTPIIEDVVAYDWAIDTKYYTANVKLCVTHQRTIGNEEFADNVQAFILLFDTSEEDSFNDVKLWLPFLKELDPAVKLLVCERCKESATPNRQTVLRWCIEHGFELIELDPEQENTEDSDDDFRDTYGIKRIIQALQAHTWHNLEMKDNSQTFRSPYMTEMMVDEAKRQKRREQRKKKLKRKKKKDNKRNEASGGGEDDGWSGYKQFNEGDSSGGDEDGHVADDRDDTDDDSSSASDSLSSDESSCDPSLHSGSSVEDLAPLATQCTPGGVCSEDVSGGDSSVSGKDGVGAAGTEPAATALTEQQLAGDEEDLAGAVGGTESSHVHDQQKPHKEFRMVDLMAGQDEALFNALGKEDPDGESFENLFENMKLMKERAASLPHDQRKEYAEKMVISFWQAVNGDPEEISGLIDSD